MKPEKETEPAYELRPPEAAVCSDNTAYAHKSAYSFTHIVYTTTRYQRHSTRVPSGSTLSMYDLAETGNY